MANILNLPAFDVLKVEENEFDYHVDVKSNLEPTACLRCGVTPPRLYRHAVKGQRFMDTPMHAKRVGVYVQRVRYKCRDCGQTFMEDLPDMDESRSATKRLIEYVQEKSFLEPFTKIADDVGITEGTVRNIFHDLVAELDARHPFATPEYVGIDEAHLLNNLRGVITNLGKRTIVDILPNKDRDTVVRRLQRMPERERVKGFSIDMHRPYLQAVNAVFPGTPVVIDKWHVQKKANEAMEEVRKEVKGGLSTKEKRVLRRDKFILRKRQHRLTPQEAFLVETWTNAYPRLAEAYRLKEGFYQVYDAPDRETAERLFEEWKASIPKDLKPLFGAVADMVGRWHEHIFAYFDHRITNAYTESVNRGLKELNRRGRGYSFEVLRARVLYKSEHVVQKPKFGREPEPEPQVMPMNYLEVHHIKPLGVIDYGASIPKLIVLTAEEHRLLHSTWDYE